MFKVKIVQQDGSIKEVSAKQDENLLDFLRQQDFVLPSPCGGKGVCGKCRVRILEGKETLKMPYLNTKAIGEAEWLQGYRLSCRLKVSEDVTVEVVGQDKIKADILTTGRYEVDLEPYVVKKFISLNKPSIDDQMSDVDRMEAALYPAQISDIALVQMLPEILRSSDYQVTAGVFGDSIISVEEGNTIEKAYGIAIDIGTTTIAGVLINLSTGVEESVYSALNPQKLHGDDVISRIDYTIENGNGLDVLGDLIINEINHMVEYFIQQTGISPEHIYQIALVGNTVMMHLFAKIPVRNIAVSPFIPVIARPIHLQAKELGINIATAGKISLIPIVAGYVGADTVGAVLASGMADSSDISLMIDIGTNGEIALGNKDKIFACSTAAGPAFEGGHIRCGLGGITGAINKVAIDDEKVNYTTIGQQPARGICGSGVVDAVAQLLKKGLVEPFGRMLTNEEALSLVHPDLAARIGEYDGKPSFIIASNNEDVDKDVIFTQKDIREVQLGKAAIAAGIKILMQELSVDYDGIKNVYLSGGFGNYIDYDHAVDIGLIPKELRDKIVPIGNGALTGSKMVIKSKACMKQAEEIKLKMHYIELSSRLDFQTIFVDYMEF